MKMLFFLCTTIIYGFVFCGFANGELASTTNDQKQTFMIGTCSASVYFAKEQRCNRGFFQSILGDSGKTHNNCSSKYNEMRRCRINVLQNCLHGSVVEYFLGSQMRVLVDNFLVLIGDEEKWCKKGGLGIPSYLYKGTNCHPIYAHLTTDCVARYEKVFNSRTTYRRLCREYKQAQTCLLRSLVTQCSFVDRPLRQMMSVWIEAQYDYQPYCSETSYSRPKTYESLIDKNTCPPYAHADVMFLLDASNATGSQERLSMKQLITKVSRELSYGMSGIRIGIAQYHESTLMSLPLDRFTNKRSFLRAFRRIRTLASKPTTSRLTGRALTELADDEFNLGETSSEVRPFHTPVVVVLATGPSADDTVEASVKRMNDKGVRVVRFGSHLKTNRTDLDVTYHVNDTRNFARHYSDVIKEICDADSSYREQRVVVPHVEEDSSSDRASILEYLRKHIFSRISGVHIPLLWETKDLEFLPFTVANVPSPQSNNNPGLAENPFNGFQFPNYGSEFGGVLIEEADSWSRFRR